MVCVPCVMLPVLLFIWHKFIQPIVLAFWNPWKGVDEKNADKNSSIESMENEKNINKYLSGKNEAMSKIDSKRVTVKKIE